MANEVLFRQYMEKFAEVLITEPNALDYHINTMPFRDRHDWYDVLVNILVDKGEQTELLAQLVEFKPQEEEIKNRECPNLLVRVIPADMAKLRRISQMLINKGYKSKYSKGGEAWLYVYTAEKKYNYGISGVALGKIFYGHAITPEEFMEIWAILEKHDDVFDFSAINKEEQNVVVSIYHKYAGLNPLVMTSEEKTKQAETEKTILLDFLTPYSIPCFEDFKKRIAEHLLKYKFTEAEITAQFEEEDELLHEWYEEDMTELKEMKISWRQFEVGKISGHGYCLFMMR
ncbi:hypothetical protein [Phascolarctobacterium sp.]|uniref:hypothetical protein n=1 Tax=Phascolarctobacterium sp. TaxID=2049039 RepID=UPI00386CCCCF